MAVDLHISERLRKLLPGLTSEELKQLKANIKEDGRVLEPILWWFDGKRHVIVDGMHRWEIVKETGVPYQARAVEVTSYEKAEIWILNHQLGRRNLLKPAAIRKIRGELYNRLKQDRGGNRKGGKSKGQIVPLIGDAAEKIGEKAGVSAKTVKRDGARVDALAGLTKPAQKAAEKASDTEIKALSRLSEEDQNSVARAIRVGQAQTIKGAIKVTGAKPEKAEKPKKKKPKPPKDYGKCPNCAGTKWKEHAKGVLCSKCNHPHGEPAGDVDAERITTQRQKTVKTVEALMRAFGDLHHLLPSSVQCAKAIKNCKENLKIAKEWK